MPMNDDDFMSVFTGQAKVAKQNYPVIPVMGTDTSYIDAKEEKQKEMAQNNAIDFSFLDDDSLGLGEKLQKFWRVQTNTQTPDERLESAEKVGNALGLVPQTLVENDDLYKNALLTYQSQKNNAYLQGQDFAPKTVAELYPELDTEDTVATTLALRDYNNVLKTREAIFQGVPTYALGTDDSVWGAYKAGAIEGANLPGYLFGKIADFATKAYDAGQALDKQSELMYRASTGEISDEEAEKELKGLVNAGKELDTAIGDSYVAKIVGETISQLSMQKNMMLRGIEKIMAPIAPLAQPVLQATKTTLPQLATLGTASALGAVGATGAAAGATVAGAAALAGAVTLGTAAVFVGTYRAEAGQAYWDWRTKRNKNGQRTYTREQAIGHAKRVGVMNAAIEAGAWELAFKGIAKVYGKEAATAVIKDTEAMKKMIGAGRKAIKLQSLKYGTKQFAKVAIPETVEEGLQSLTADIDTNLFGEGGISKKEMFNNALDAMIQAVPSVIGMSAGGSLVGGVGAYRAMKKISGLSEMEEACMEFKRTNEKTMLEKIMELRKESSLFQKAPEAYRKTIQKQMDQSGMGTVYIDAQTAAENEDTHEALNEMVEKGIVSAKELDESIKTGKPLTVKSGKYLQLASETTPETLADYTTMDKGERTLHAIKEERERLKNLISLVTGTKEKREKAAAEKILNEHFSEDTEKGREDRATAQELLSGGLDNLQENYKSLLQEAKETWGKLSGVKELQDYMERRKTQDANMSNEKGVDFVDTGEGPDRVHTRESKNPDWYQDFYGDNDRAPNQRELYDIAHEKTIRENDKGDDASKVGIQELEAAKAKVESLERVGEVIKTLDKEDLVAQTLLDPDTYEEAYKPLLEQLGKGNAAVTKAARDSALVLAKLAENFHKNYGVPLKLATMEIMKENPSRIKDIKKEEQSVSRDLAESRRSWGPALPYINILHQFLRGSNIRNALPSKTEVREISENASSVIKETVAELKPADFTPSTFKRELYTELSKGTAEDILANTIKLLKSYSDIDIYDPLGNKIYFAPPDGESIEQYATHLIAGHEEKLDETSRARALGIRLALETIKNPMAIILQENGRKQYLSLYSDGTNRLHQIVVGVQEDEKGRIITSFMKDAKRKDKNAPFARFKKQIATSKKVLYIRGLDNRQGRSEHSRPQADQWVSKLSAKLHPFGNSIISQEELENNESFHQMGGEFAETAPLDKLKHAEQMEIEGAEPEEIWKQTGWVRGPEGLWRFEIPDNLDNMHLDRLSEDFCYLDEIYNNPELYQAYPELADTKIKVEDFSKAYEGKYANAGGMTDNGVIVLNKEYLSHTPDEKVKKIILHELQHIIQDTVEPGFSKGGNKAVAKKQMESTLHTLELELKNKARVFESVKKYLSAHEKLAKAFDEGDFKTAFAAMDEKKEAGTKLKIADKQYLDRRLEQIAYIKEALKGGDYVAYRRLGGEAEAFMVMDRANNSKGEFPNYDTGYGAPVANFGGISHSLMAAREMNDRADSLVAFKKLLYEDMKKGWAASSEKWTSQSGVTYNGERITHVIKKHHLTDEQLADIDKNINNLSNVGISKFNGQGQYGGAHIIALLEGDLACYRINLDFTENGAVKFGTAFPAKKEAIIKSIEDHTSQVLPVKTVADSLGRASSMPIPTIQKELGIVKEENTGYYQTAYHGSPYEFNTFDLGAIGNGEGNQVHGWGLYFTKDKTIAETRYRDRLLKWLRKKEKLTDNDKGTVFEVEVPEDNVLLDEDKPVNEQPLAVRKAIAAYYKSRPDDYIAPDESDLDYRDIGNQTGERFYKDVVFQMRREGQEHPQKAASELLNSFGIKGITYDGRIDGRCFVVFDDQAISIIEKYNQAVNGSQYQGAYNPTSNVIEIFDGANQSTAIHEGAHMFLTSLEKLAEMPEEELLQAFNGDENAVKASRKKVLADLQTIRNWASFSEKHLEEYKGTSLEKEFNAHAEAIRRGDANAEEIWMQERFARGFEKYLMDGSAPTKELRGVFRRFKSWLTDIYKAAKNLGNVELTPEIKDVFDKMLATENEINAWAAQRKLESIDKAINVDKSELDNLKEWAENVKQKALEKAMSYYLHMVKEDAIEQFKNSISSEEARKDFMQKLGEENELYKIEQIYNSPTFPTKKEREDFLKSNGIASEEELKKKLQDSGGTSEERWNKNISDMVQSYKDEALTPEAVQAMAEDILNSPEGLERKAKIETMLLEKKVTQYINLVTSMQLELKRSKNKAKTVREIRKRLGLATEKETAELEKQSATIAKSEEKITKLEKQVKELREKLKATKETAETAKEENKSRKESAEILEGNLKAIQQELEKERAAHAKLQETNDDTNLTVAELSAKLKAIKEGWVESRTAMRVNMQLIKEDARNTLGEETLSHATSWRWWQAKASAAETKAMKAAAENDWNQAAYWKQVQGQDLIMAKQARANEDEIRHTLYGGGGKLTTAMLNENGMEKYGILGIINRIGRSENPILMKDDARYFVQHLAYVLGMTKTDGRLPIDQNGMEREFSWKWLAVEMNPMIAMENPNYKAEDIIPDWIRAAFNGNQPMKMKDLTMNQFREMAKVMKAVYRLGRREYEGNTLGTSFDNASEEISNEIMKKWEKSGHRITTPQIKVATATEKERKKTRFHDLVRSITLPEILIERMGKKAYQYIYQPIDKATAKRRELKAEARKTFQENFKMYTVKEWAVMRNKKVYKYGIDDGGNSLTWTKEEVLCMALNFGTQSNRNRLIESLWGNEEQLMKFLDSVLDDRDWTFVEKVWAHENSYWGARNKIQNDLYGVPLGKVKGLNFYNKDGRLIHGQYYRIKYDPDTSSKTGHLAKDDIARMDMENMSAFSLGMGSTKKRALTSGGQKLRFDLDVYTESVQEAIQHVAMREATVDVYKLLNQKDVIAAIETTMGVNTLGELQNWVKDNWHSSIRDMCEWDTFFAQCRRKFTFATMGFRFSTALLNLCNIFGMMERIGAGNALKAVGDFYFKGGMKEKWNFITAKSSMMKERAATMDRDTYIGDDMPVKRHESKLRSKIEHGKFGTDSINSKAYALIAYTDMLFSCPEWLHVYQRTMVELEQEGQLSREEMDQEAVRRADKAVRETFGSGETKDQTEFIRKNNALAQATAFFSYTNIVTNQFIRAGYIKYDTGNIKPLLKATWYWWILGSLLETVLRVWGDDSDDEDKWKNKLAHVLASSGPTGGIPAFRDAIPWAVDFFVAGKSPGDMAPNLSALDSFGYAQKTLTSLGKGDIVEAGRATSKLFTRTAIPIPDTLTDAFWNFIRLIGTDNNYTITDYLWKSLWDKPLKEEKKKGKKKE